MWPRMSYAQLARLFPDGKTVHIAADGRTLPRYEEARAELAANGTAVASLPPAQNSGIGAFFAWLFNKGGSGDDEDNAASQQQAPAPAVQTAAAQAPAAPETAMQADVTGSISDHADAAAAEPQATAAQTAEVDMPLPPERPTGLMAADVPLPPERPALALAASPGRAAKPAPMVVAEAETAAPELPGIITQGPNDGRPTQELSRRSYGALPQALAYAPVAQMEGLRSAVRGAQAAASAPKPPARAAVTIVPARLDGSNFGTLTGSTDVAELASATIFGPTLTGLRSAAQGREQRPVGPSFSRLSGALRRLGDGALRRRISAARRSRPSARTAISCSSTAGLAIKPRLSAPPEYETPVRHWPALRAGSTQEEARRSRRPKSRGPSAQANRRCVP